MKTETRYEISVWDHEGDIVEKLWDASEDDLEEVREKYSDEPLLTVVVDRDWEETVYDDED